MVVVMIAANLHTSHGIRSLIQHLLFMCSSPARVSVEFICVLYKTPMCNCFRRRGVNAGDSFSLSL